MADLDEVLSEIRARLEELQSRSLRAAALSAEEAAIYFGGPPVTAAVIKRLAASGDLGHAKVGRTTVFPVEALDAYLQTHTVPAAPNPWGLTARSRRTIVEGSPRERLRNRTF